MVTRLAYRRLHRPRSLTALLATLMAMSSGAMPLAAQNASAGRAAVTGTVRDVSTGAPVDSVLIVLPGLRISTRTDRSGAFTLTNVPEGTHQWSVIRLGYVPLNQEMQVKDGDHFNIGVMQRPVELEGFTVVGSRAEQLLRRRRNAAPESVREFAGADLARRAASNGEELIRGLGAFMTCPTEIMMARMVEDCVYDRGRMQPVQVYVDEQPIPGGLVLLSAYLPSELHSVEVWTKGTEVRVYTRTFARKLGQGRARLRPRGFGL